MTAQNPSTRAMMLGTLGGTLAVLAATSVYWRQKQRRDGSFSHDICVAPFIYKTGNYPYHWMAWLELCTYVKIRKFFADHLKI